METTATPRYKVRGRVVQGRIEIIGCWKLASKNPHLMNTLSWSRAYRPFSVFDIRLEAPSASLAKQGAIDTVRRYFD